MRGSTARHYNLFPPWMQFNNRWINRILLPQSCIWAYSDVREKITHDFAPKLHLKWPVWAYSDVREKITHDFG